MLWLARSIRHVNSFLRCHRRTLVTGLQKGKILRLFDVEVSAPKKVPKLCTRLLGLGRFRILNLQHLTIYLIDKAGDRCFTHLSSGTPCTCGK